MITIDTQSFPAAGGQFTITISKSDLWDWSSVVIDSANWYTVISSQSVSNQEWEIVVDVDRNNVMAERIMAILVETESEQETFQIPQEAADAPDPTGEIVSVTPSGDLPATAGTLTVDVKVNNGNDSLTSGQIISGSSFCTLVSVTHGVTSGNNTVTRFVYNIAANSVITTRSLELRFTVTNGSIDDVVSLTKTQLGSTPAPIGTIESVSPSGNISAEGGQLIYDIHVENGNDALTSQSIVTGGAFVTLQSTTHNYSTNTTRFVYAVAANSDTSSRSIEIQFTVSNGTDTATVTGSKMQAGTVPSGQLSGEVLSVTPSGIISASGSDVVIDVEVQNGNDDLTTAEVTSGSDFCDLVNIDHGVVVGGHTVSRCTFSVGANTTFMPRVALITINVSDGTDSEHLTVTLNQMQNTPDLPTGIVQNESPVGDMGASGGVLIYDIRTIIGTDALTTAEVITGGAYVTLQNTQHGIVSGGYVVTRFTFRVAENQGGQSRPIVIRFWFSDGTLEGLVDVSKTQNAAESERITLEPNYSVLPWYVSPEYQNARKWWVYGRIYPLFTPATKILPFQLMRTHRSGTSISSFLIYTAQGELIGDYRQAMVDAGLQIKQFPDAGYDVIVFPGRFPVFSSMANGQYYAVLSDGTETWYSEIFTVVNDISPYLMIEWWDKEDFVVDGAAVVYTNPTFHNILFLDSDLAKPEYNFDEEGEKRDGYFFPSKQISEKKYKFAFWASEYLLDVIRLIRMADYVRITYNGKTYRADSFLITPEWEDQGDIAKVEAEFETATVAKKLGLGYVRSLGGDFNNDFNDDYLTS